MRYELWVQGCLGASWSRWFDGLEVDELEDGSTRMCGDLPDQAALHGILDKLRDLGMILVAVQLLDARGAGRKVDRAQCTTRCPSDKGPADGQGPCPSPRPHHLPPFSSSLGDDRSPGLPLYCGQIEKRNRQQSSASWGKDH